MNRILGTVLAVAVVCIGLATAQGIQQGKLKSVDAKKKLVVITLDGKDREYAVAENARLPGGRGDTVEEKLAGYKPGTNVQFLYQMRDGKAVLTGLRPEQGGGTREGKAVSPDHSKFKPLNELGEDKYQGHMGGLYPGGKNVRPEKHEKAGMELARKVKPLDAEGKPSEKGKIVMLSVGMSNTSQISIGFQEALRGAKGVNPAVIFVNGAQGGMTAQRILNVKDERGGAQYWKVVDDRLKSAGVTALQVQVVWIKQANIAPREGFPGYPRKLQGELKHILQIIAKKFPNARLCYLSSRTYGGYATTPLNPEPVAYESGFAVKWLIEEQLKGDANLDYTTGKAPWLSWGPYLWANGKAKAPGGLYSVPEDFAKDGTHHSPAGMRKMGQELFKFLQTDTTTKPWFLKAE